MKTGDWLRLLGVVFVAGFVLATLIFALGGKLREIVVGPAKWEMPDNATSTIPFQQTSETSAHPTTPPSSVRQPTPGQFTPTPESSSTEPRADSGLESLREHYQVDVGEGIFAEGTFSDGMAPYSEQWLRENDRFHIQRIRFEEFPDGCDVARYNTDVIWITGSPGMSLVVNGDNLSFHPTPLARLAEVALHAFRLGLFEGGDPASVARVKPAVSCK